jgi:hypothetical protein
VIHGRGAGPGDSGRWSSARSVPSADEPEFTASPLFWWLYDRESELIAIAKSAKSDPTSWQTLADKLVSLGIRGDDGAPTGTTVRATWHRLVASLRDPGRAAVIKWRPPDNSPPPTDPLCDTTRVTWGRVQKALDEEGRPALERRRPAIGPMPAVRSPWWRKLTAPERDGRGGSRKPLRMLTRRRRGKSRRTPLFWWMYDHRQAMRDLERRGRISWITFCRQAAMLGLVDAAGGPILPHLARATWRCVKDAIRANRV